MEPDRFVACWLCWCGGMAMAAGAITGLHWGFIGVGLFLSASGVWVAWNEPRGVAGERK